MKPKSRNLLFLALGGTALATMPTSRAANYYWDNNGATSGFGTASGTWAEPTLNQWNTSNSGGNNMQASRTILIGDDVFFGTDTVGLGAGTITVSGTVDVRNMTFGAASGAIVLSGDTINLGATSVINANNSSNTINSVLSGAATSFTKAGSGTLILGGTNTFTGQTIINAGTLDLGGGTANGSLDSTVLTLNGGSFAYTRTGNTTQAFTTTN
ncbi:MAG TPA: autotransporter-associated beta strand repeat-containing protein, partial [Verrucomicrobiae bacterium]|nr:autotransporter-associated beta strand repeat-containing protein [Verrucomicrobiae bacterium]